MIEENIIEWLELGDAIQKIGIYNKRRFFFLFQANYLLNKYSNFSDYLYIFFIWIFFFQIWELNILKINVEGDGLLEILKYLENIFLLINLKVDKKSLILLLTFTIGVFISSNILTIININCAKKNKKILFLLSLNSFLNTLFIYYLNGPSIEILLSIIICNEGEKNILCSLKKISNLILFIIIIIGIIFILGELFFAALYFNNIGCIDGSNAKSRINCNFTLIISIIKLIFFLFHFIIFYLVNDNQYYIISLYYLFILLANIFISIYVYKYLFFYNYLINSFFQYGCHFTNWFSFCIFIKQLIGISDITLFVLIGIIIIIIGLYYNKKYMRFKLLTEFNIFESNDLKTIEMYCKLLLDLLNINDNYLTILIAGVINRFEENLQINRELLEQYNKLINDKHLQKKFSLYNELKILSIISIIYTYNIEKSTNKTDISLNMCYFLVNKFKNPAYAIWLCTKIKEFTHIQSFYSYTLMEEIKQYLIDNLNKNTNKLTIKKVQISSVILYNQYVDIFKMKIYDSTCNQIEYFDILRNSVTTIKTTENFLKFGEDVLSIRKDILSLWEKLILLNPFSDEIEKVYMIYLETILNDDILARTEEKRFNSLKTEKLSKRNNPYYSMFNQDISTVLLADGYSFNGKIFYASPNFASLFMLNGKEILNTTINDLLPDVIQSFHKYLVEDSIKYSNLGHIFKRQKNIFLKGKNDIIFNAYLFVKPCPNLTFGLIFFIYLQKFSEQNFIVLLDENLIINGFTQTNITNNNITMSNNYGLSHYINGHHIGLIIPEIILHMDYDIKNNTFLLHKNNIDLKGNLYSISNFKDLDDKIKNIIHILKQRKNNELNENNKLNSFEEYEDFIKELNLNCQKAYSIFFRIEEHSFIKGKYKYYRINIINDLLIENEIEKNSSLHSLNDGKEISIKNIINKNISKTKLKDLSKEYNYTTTDNPNINSNLKIKFIKLKPELKSKTNYIISEKLESNIHNNEKEINLLDEANINKQNIENTSINNKNNLLFNNGKKSIYSALSKSSGDSTKFNKLKKDIINKNDSFYAKLMKYLYIIYMIIIFILSMFDFIYTQYIMSSMVEFLQQNIFFNHTKINSACIFNSAATLKFLQKGYINNHVDCIIIDCHIIYGYLLDKCIKEVCKQKNNISYYYPDYQKVFNQKINIELSIYNRNYKDHLSLDINNYLNMIISQGMKILENLSDIFYNRLDKYSMGILENYLENLLDNSIKYFYSDYSGFKGKEKDSKIENISRNSPLRLIISIILIIIIIIIFTYLICKINFIELYFLERLINFNSNSFDEYIKNLNELKKKFRDDNNDEDEKNDEFEIKGDDGNENAKNKKESIIKDDNNDTKKKKNKKSKLQQQKIKKKKIMSTYFYKLNVFFGIKIGLIFIITMTYFIVSLMATSNLKKNYKKFDSIIGEINSVYYDSFKILLKFNEQIEMYTHHLNRSLINIPKDSEIERIKFGNSLLFFTKNNKYSEDSLNELNNLYNNDACQILSQNLLDYYLCISVFSSILTKGMEQAVIQMNIIITSVIDELNSFKEYKSLREIMFLNSSFSNYEIFMSEFMLLSFLKTQDIFDVFRNNERINIYAIGGTILLVYYILFIIIIIYIHFLIYKYKNLVNSFFNFIGILPTKFLFDDENFYKTIIKLENDFY